MWEGDLLGPSSMPSVTDALNAPSADLCPYTSLCTSSTFSHQYRHFITCVSFCCLAPEPHLPVQQARNTGEKRPCEMNDWWELIHKHLNLGGLTLRQVFYTGSQSSLGRIKSQLSTMVAWFIIHSKGCLSFPVIQPCFLLVFPEIISQ